MTKIDAKTLATAGLGLAILIAPSVAFQLAQRELQKRFGLPASIAFTLVGLSGIAIWDAVTREAYDADWQEVLDNIDATMPTKK